MPEVFRVVAGVVPAKHGDFAEVDGSRAGAPGPREPGGLWVLLLQYGVQHLLFRDLARAEEPVVTCHVLAVLHPLLRHAA